MSSCVPEIPRQTAGGQDDGVGRALPATGRSYAAREAVPGEGGFGMPCSSSTSRRAVGTLIIPMMTTGSPAAATPAHQPGHVPPVEPGRGQRRP